MGFEILAGNEGAARARDAYGFSAVEGRMSAPVSGKRSSAFVMPKL